MFALCYFNENELAVHPPGAPGPTRCTTASSAHCSPRPGPTATTSGRPSRAGIMTNDPRAAAPATAGSRSSTGRISKGVSARYYHVGPPLLGHVRRSGAAAWTHPISRVRRTTARRATLPNITFVDPAFRDGEFSRRPLDRRAPPRRRAPGPGLHGRRRERLHPLAELPQAARCSSPTTSGAASSTTCARRARSTTAPPANLDEDFAQMGFRIPAVTVSPWTRRPAGGPRFRVDHGDLRVRVDPQADLLPLRPRLPDQATPLCPQHRPRLRLGAEARLRPGLACPTRPRWRPRPAPPEAMDLEGGARARRMQRT